MQKLRIAPSASFSITDWTVFIIFNVVIGGIGSFEGPIIGTIVYFVLRQYLGRARRLEPDLLGTFSIAIMLVEKRGLWGLIRRALSDDLIPIAHKPSATRATATKAKPKA